jgi:hypothetical protein
MITGSKANKLLSGEVVFTLGIGILCGALVLAPLALYGLPLILVALAAVVFFLQKPYRALLVLVVLLPFHVLVMSVLLGVIGLPIQGVRLIAAWKEALVIGTVAHLFLMLCTGYPLRFRATLPDFFAIALLMLTVVYLIVPSEAFGAPISLTGKLYGFRDMAMFIVMYFIGRLVPVSDKGMGKILKFIFYIGLSTSVVGIVERFLVPLEVYVRIGVPKYFSDFLGVQYATPYSMGLPANYFTAISGHLVRRAASVYMSGQGFAVSFLILVPVATYLMYSSQPASRVKSFIVSGLFILALILTITRMTIASCAVQVILLGLLIKKQRISCVIVALIVLTMLAMLITNTGLFAYITKTLRLQTASGEHHLIAYEIGINSLTRHPFGQGLGSASQTAGRFGGVGSAFDNQYFAISGSLGWPGLLLYLSLLSSIFLLCLGAYRQQTDIYTRGIVLVVLVAGVGIAINSFTAVLYNAPFIVYVYWWMAGLAMQLISARRANPIAKSCRS